MKLCPYCQRPIDEKWRFCHHCNKPLLTSYTNELPISSTYQYQRNINDQSYNFEESRDFDINIIEDDKIDKKILEIDDQINQKPYGDGVGDLFLEKASLYFKKRDLSQSLKELERALSSFENENNLNKMAITHNEIGLLKEEIGYFEDSIYHFKRAINIFKNLKDNVKLIQVYNNIGNAYYQLKDIENAYICYQKAIELAENENMKYEEVKSSSNMVEILFILQDYERIKKILKNNHQFFNEKNDIYGIITTYSKYGKLNFYLGENYYEKSYNYLINALELIEKVEEQLSIYLKARMRWEIYLFLGKINLLWNNFEKAETFLLNSLESVRTFEIEDDNIKESSILEALGNLYEIMKKYDKAIEYFKLSSEIYYKFGEDSKTGELKTKIAHIYYDYLKNNIDAIDYYEQALEIFMNIDYYKEIAKIHNKLGDLYLEGNITEIAINHFEIARKYYHELHDNYHIELLDEKINSLIK